MSENIQNKAIYADIFGEKLQINVIEEYSKDECVTISKYDENGDRADIISSDGKLLEYTVYRKNGSIEYYNRDNKKCREKTADGITRQFNNGKKTREEFADGSIITYFDDESVKYRKNADGSFIEYYERDKIKEKGDAKSFYSYSPEGDLQYKIENRKMWISPSYYSFVRIGMKTTENDEHWTEDFELNPKIKTIVCYGGDSTHTARGGNGNINSFMQSLGFTAEQQNNMQMLAHYNPQNWDLIRRVRRYKITNYGELIDNDYRKETAKAFMPFIAQKTQNGWEKLSSEELSENMRNLLNLTHCYGTNEMMEIAHALKFHMQKLGYEQSLINKAFKQNLCITNNTRRDFNDNTKMTILHRYSVCDGPGDEMYDVDYTNAYQTQLDKKAEFNALKGNKSAFININKEEILMVFDKVLSTEKIKYSSTEHNQAFFEYRQQYLTDVGEQQMKLTREITQFWYHNHNEMPDAADLLRQCAKNAGVESFTEKSFVAGKILQKEHNNPLMNPHVLEVAKNRFNNPDIEPEHTGVWKLLNATKQQEK